MCAIFNAAVRCCLATRYHGSSIIRSWDCSICLTWLPHIKRSLCQLTETQLKTDMGAADPTYPLLPIAKFLAAAMLFLVLLTNFVRQRWNTGLSFLCFWLCLEALADGTNAIIWSDNADIKLYVYCDIGALSTLLTVGWSRSYN